MVGIRLFIEGGGDSELTRSKMRKGFAVFFKSLVDLVRLNKDRFTWHGVVPCGKRTTAYKDFRTALKQFPDDFNILLVDAEDPMPEKCTDKARRNWEHLKLRDGDKWDCPENIDDRQCFLMIACMETWLIADRDAITVYYGKNFNANTLPKNTDLQSVAKATIADCLKRATERTQKGEYHKTRHAFDILRTVDVAAIRAALPECDRLFQELETRIAASETL